MENDKHVLYEGTIEEINKKIAEGQSNQEPAAGSAVEPVPATASATEPPAASAPAEPAEPAVTTTEAFDRYKFLSETFSTEFKGDDDFNAWKSTITEKATKYDDLQRQFEQAQAELKAVDPLKFFASKDKYIENQLLIKYPDYDPAVVSRVLTTDIATTDPVRLIADMELMHDPKKEVFATEEQAYKYVCKKLGYDPELPLAEQDDDVQVSVRAGAKEARAEFNKLKTEIEVPKPIDLTAQKAEQEKADKDRYDKFKPLIERDLQSVTAGLDKIDVTRKTKDGKTEVLFSYDLGDFKNSKTVKDTLSEVLEFTARNAREWDKATADKAIKAVTDSLRNDYIVANLPQLLEAHRDQVEKELKDKRFEKDNNHRPLNPDVTNPAMTEEQKKLKSLKDKVKQELGLKGKLTYAP